MANKISVILDFATDKAVGGLKGFKNAINDADGAVGKMKAGAGAAFGALQGAAVTALAAAGAAAVAFSVKSVQAFTDTAVAAGKLADATGLSSEEASRWTAVADDIGISSESMEKSFGKLAVSIGKNNPLLEQYGITVQKGADGQADMNATMLHAIEVIRNIQDPTTKAAVAQAALGKGWMEMSELIEQGSATLTESMAEVSEAQVIDPEEVEKARKMRASMDELQDAIRDVSLTLGEDLVPMAVAGADALTTIIEPLSSINQWTKDVTLGFLELVGVIDKLPGDTAAAGKGIGQMATQLDEASGAGHMHIEMQEGLKTATDDSTEATEKASKTAVDYGKSLQTLQDALDRRIAATNALVGGDIAVRDAQREAKAAVDELTVATDEQKLSTEELSAMTDAAALELIDAASAAAEYDEKIGNAAGKTMTAAEKQDAFKAKLGEVAATLAPGSPLRTMLEEYIALLEGIPTQIDTNVRVTRTGDLITPINGMRAAGGPVSAGHTYLVGERGMELFTPATAGYITPHNQLAAGWSSGGSSPAAAGNVTLVVEGNIYGDKHLRAQLDTWARGVQRESAGAK